MRTRFCTLSFIISLSTHTLLGILLLLALKNQALSVSQRKQPVHQAPVHVRKRLQPPLPPPPSPVTIPISPVVPNAPPVQHPPPPVVSRPVPGIVPQVSPAVISPSVARPPQSSPSALPATAKHAISPRAEPVAPPEVQQKPRPQRVHAWKRMASAKRVQQRQKCHYGAHEQDQFEMISATHHSTTNSPHKQSEATRAREAAHRFHSDFARKKAEDYIRGIGQAICFKQNSHPLVIAPCDVPHDLILTVVVDKSGELLHAEINKVYADGPAAKLSQHLLQSTQRAAPFRPIPSDLPSPLQIPFFIFPSSMYTPDRESSQAIPLMLSVFSAYD